MRKHQFTAKSRTITEVWASKKEKTVQIRNGRGEREGVYSEDTRKLGEVDWG